MIALTESRAIKTLKSLIFLAINGEVVKYVTANFSFKNVKCLQDSI